MLPLYVSAEAPNWPQDLIVTAGLTCHVTAGLTFPLAGVHSRDALELLGQAVSPDGTVLNLTRRDNEYFILANCKSLMSSDIPY